MAARLDLIIFGASGYTGRFVVPEMFRICKNYPEIRWAIAGRSKSKLERVLRDSAKAGENTSPIKIIAADTRSYESLKVMCSQCKVVLNCCGPYVTTGEAVVRAAVDCQTHYVDVCSELPFLEKILAKYDEAARNKGVFVINACGLGCIPADLGVVFLQQNFKGTLNSVEAYLTTQIKVSKKWPANVMRDSTWEGLIQGLKEKPLWDRTDKKNVKIEPQLKPRPFIHERHNRWSVPFPGAEETIVQRTQNHINSRPIQFKRYHSFPNLFASIATTIFGIFLFVLCKIFRLSNLLIKYPRVCSFGLVTYGDPDEELMGELSFDYEMYGEGWRGEVEGRPRDHIVARIRPEGKNAPYEGTAVAAVYAALTLLTERDKMPATYGVLTPGGAFKNTSIIQKYNNDKLKFEIIDKN
ncbi:saccharopine dehydrogenase-like oxidoreductase [Colias croceus]|uniref:saccharopine dehydrogenase-like oxidoreductase n=1 Tax=Colias crocea TaxID=72248 RepID=UPI001E27CB82|nr:saccharopine dehydrogenase-like oxidoreductase [Colias croceus]XP_045496848.1 saccharopine dehydrogenase-like oxidoreductase [Colias croceus]